MPMVRLLLGHRQRQEEQLRQTISFLVVTLGTAIQGQITWETSITALILASSRETSITALILASSRETSITALILASSREALITALIMVRYSEALMRALITGSY